MRVLIYTRPENRPWEMYGSEPDSRSGRPRRRSPAATNHSGSSGKERLRRGFRFYVIRSLNQAVLRARERERERGEREREKGRGERENERGRGGEEVIQRGSFPANSIIQRNLSRAPGRLQDRCCTRNSLPVYRSAVASRQGNSSRLDG